MNVIIVHGWGGNPESDWYNWLKEELVKRKINSVVPEMPDTLKPSIHKWINQLGKLEINENTILIGHSIGCQTIMRYLEKSNKKVKAVIFVAGWINLKEETWDETYTHEVADPWLNTNINFDKIKGKSKKFIAIASDNDPYVLLSDAEIFKKKLKAEIIVLKNKGHISGEDGFKEFPLLLNKVLELTT